MGNASVTDTAFKVRIKDIINGEFIKSESQLNQDYLNITSIGKVLRVRVMATVVSRFINDNQKFALLTLDDGSDTITIRSFGDEVEMLMNVNPGDIVDVIGKVKEYDEEKYISTELLWNVENPNWELVRHLELLIQDQNRGNLNPSNIDNKTSNLMEDTLDIEEEIIGEDPKIIIINILDNIDTGHGVSVTSIIEESGLGKNVVEETIGVLMGKGEIYEPKVGMFKLV
tara:strand:+ start:267 stop:950 length:684 start_codon:yes stop_codon:yes gene_type:complete